jgi:hypothetical protein
MASIAATDRTDHGYGAAPTSDLAIETTESRSSAPKVVMPASCRNERRAPADLGPATGIRFELAFCVFSGSGELGSM